MGFRARGELQLIMRNLGEIRFRKISAEEEIFQTLSKKYYLFLKEFEEFAKKETLKKQKSDKISGKASSYKRYLIRLIILIQETVENEIKIESQEFKYQLLNLFDDLSFTQYNDNEGRFPSATINCYCRYLEERNFSSEIKELSNAADIVLHSQLCNESSKELYINNNYESRNPAVQQKFREEVLKKYNQKCLLCEIDIVELLIASHIKGYSHCERLEEASSTNNGLLLCAHHDALFDKGIISFDLLGKIIVSSLYEKKMNLLQLDDKMQISKFITNTEIVSNLEFHRKYTFKG